MNVHVVNLNELASFRVTLCLSVLVSLRKGRNPDAERVSGTLILFIAPIG